MVRGSLPPMSNRESFIDEITLVDPDDGTLWDLTDVTAKVQLELVDVFYPQWGQGYGLYFNYGWYPQVTLVATTENGAAVIVASEAIQFTFTLAQMETLRSGQYRLSATITRDSETIQLFQLDIPILDGGVPQ